jgi:hypothetical protein
VVEQFSEADCGVSAPVTLAPGYLRTGAAPEGQQRLADKAQHVAWLAGAGRPDFPAVAVLRVAAGATLRQTCTAAGIAPDAMPAGTSANLIDHEYSEVKTELTQNRSNGPVQRNGQSP